MSFQSRFGFVMFVIAGSAALGAVHASAQPRTSSCVACHASLPQAALAAPVKAFQGDVHQQRGFACVDCHGGDPAAAEKAGAHGAARGYRGKPTGQQIVATCARCHSDAGLMHKFSPKQRVDQATEYASSVHGKRLAAGDTRVATCVTCHGAHDVRLVNDARSPAYTTNVAATCAACHSSPEHMKPYTRPDGSPLPTNQRADYERSVHHAALVKQNDMSAPTCNDCHGNHGAAPPGVSSLTTVCGTCHAVFQTKFATSVHAQIFEKACVECHGNHAVLAPSDGMLGTSKPAVCASCHEDKDDPGFVGAAAMLSSMDRLRRALDSSSALIARVKNEGMEVGDQELALNEARSKLVLARTEIHAFDPAALDAVVTDATTILAGIDRAGTNAVGELAFRRRGLFVSLGVIVLFVMGLAFKIKELNMEDKH